jgi:hypothetical protein
MKIRVLQLKTSQSLMVWADGNLTVNKLSATRFAVHLQFLGKILVNSSSIGLVVTISLSTIITAVVDLSHI